MEHRLLPIRSVNTEEIQRKFHFSGGMASANLGNDGCIYMVYGNHVIQTAWNSRCPSCGPALGNRAGRDTSGALQKPPQADRDAGDRRQADERARRSRGAAAGRGGIRLCFHVFFVSGARITNRTYS
mgnify:CR=1 FL=1